jgi:hypothetical protein
MPRTFGYSKIHIFLSALFAISLHRCWSMKNSSVAKHQLVSESQLNKVECERLFILNLCQEKTRQQAKEAMYMIFYLVVTSNSRKYEQMRCKHPLFALIPSQLSFVSMNKYQIFSMSEDAGARIIIPDFDQQSTNADFAGTLRCTTGMTDFLFVFTAV